MIVCRRLWPSSNPCFSGEPKPFLPAPRIPSAISSAVLEPYILWNSSSFYLKKDGECHSMSPVVSRPGKSRQPLNDTRLVKACLSGDEAAWSLLIDKYKP